MAADDTEGAATAPCSMLCCSHLSLTKHHLPSASWVHLLLAVTILTAPIITALHPADGSPHGHTNQPLEEDHKAHFGPHLHGPDVLPDGSQWLLFQEHWRVVGNRLATPNFTAALEDAAGIIYSQYSFHGVYAGSHVSHAAPVFLDGQPVELQELDQDEFSAAVLSDYDSLDVAVDVSIDKNAWFPDLGSVSDTNHERLTNLMRSDGFDVTAWMCLGYTLTSRGAMIMSHMPIPRYQSDVIHLEVTGANLVPFTLQKQNLVTAVLSDLLSFASVFSVRLIHVEQQTPFPGDAISTASLFVVTQQDTCDLFVGEAVMRVITDPLGTPLFDTHMASAGLPVTATMRRVDPFQGDSITDQINHDPGRPPWTQPWEVSVLTLGAVGFAIITGFSAYICNKRIVKPLVLQRMWARRKQTDRQQGTEALDIEMAQGGLQRMSAAFAQKLAPQHRSVMSQLRALLSPSSVLYSQLADQPSSLDQPGSSSQALDGPAAELEGSVHAAEGGADPPHPHLKGRDANLPWGGPLHGSQQGPLHPQALSVLEFVSLTASKEMACSRSFPQEVMMPPEIGVTKGGQTSLPPGSSGGQLAGWVIDPDEITFCEHPVRGGLWQLGSGSYGVVYKAKRGLQDAAVKTLHSHLMDPHISPTQAHDSICRELKILKHALTDPELVMRQEVTMLRGLSYDTNVVQFYGSCVKDGKILLVLEYMEGGDLKHALKGLGERSQQLQWYKMGSSIALDVIKGIHFLHMHGVLHRDIKTANVLLSKSYDKAKICDVGLAHIMGTTGATCTSNHPVQATFAYCSPEMLFNQRCREAADIYSYGVVLWEIITQETPQRGNLRDIEVPAECPQDIADLVDRCLGESPEIRPSAHEIFHVITESQLMHPAPPNPD